MRNGEYRIQSRIKLQELFGVICETSRALYLLCHYFPGPDGISPKSWLFVEMICYFYHYTHSHRINSVFLKQAFSWFQAFYYLDAISPISSDRLVDRNNMLIQQHMKYCTSLKSIISPGIEPSKKSGPNGLITTFSTGWELVS